MATRRRRWLTCCGWVLVAGLQPLLALSATAPAGQSIINTAQASYITSNGKSETALTDTLQITVAQNARFVLAANQARRAVAGSTVYFTHQLTNTGNGTDRFDLGIANGSGDFPFPRLALFPDVNGDDLPDAGAPISSTGPLAAGAVFRFIAIAATPGSALAEQASALSIIARGNAEAASSGHYTPAYVQRNIDTVTTTNGPVIAVSKSLDIVTGPSPYDNSGRYITVTLTYSNSGRSAATQLVIKDVIGLAGSGFNTQAFAYVPGSASWNGVPLSDALGGDTNGIAYDFNQTEPLTVRAAIASVAPQQMGVLRFKVRVLPNFPAGTSFSNNIATFTYRASDISLAGISNSATYTIIGPTQGPDLLLTKTHNGTFSVGHPATYTLRVLNAGGRSSDGQILVTDSLPPGLSYDRDRSGGTGWSCSAAGSLVTCITSVPAPASSSSAPGEHPNPLTIGVIPDASAFPVLPAQVINNATVSGGGESPSNSANNNASDSTTVQNVAKVSGRVWRDLSHDNIFEAATEGQYAMSGWLAEVCPVDVQDCNASTRIASATTGSDGSYSVTDLPPGQYKLQFRDPLASSVTMRPTNGESGVPQPNSQEDPGQRYLIITLGGGDAMVQQSLPLDPSGVIFDSMTRQPIAGVTATLAGPPGFENFLVGGPSNRTQITGMNGVYQFLLLSGFPAGTYTITVTAPSGYQTGPSKLFPPQPGALTPPTGCVLVQPTICSVEPTNLPVPPPSPTVPRYFMSFNLVSGNPDIVNNHIAIDPVNAVPPGGLLVSKTASRSAVELGEFVDYAVKVQNSNGLAFPSVSVRDTLPQGFTYVKGSVRLNGVALAEPTVRAPSLEFALGALAANTTSTLTYRVRVGPSAQLGNGINSAQAFAGTAVSNVASVKVDVLGGVFSDRGYILGKVFLDCNRNGVQDRGEVGVPGVGLLLEDGTSVLTDSEGKFSFYGIVPRLHVLKVDRITLPSGAQLSAIANRFANDPDSRFVDLKNGELHRADFAIASCAPQVLEQVTARRKIADATPAEIERMLQRKLTADSNPVPTGDRRAQPAAGIVSPTSAASTAGAASRSFEGVAPAALNASNSNLPPEPVATVPSEDLEALIPELDNRFDFIGLKDGDTLPIAQTNVRVKGPMGITFRLRVNDVEVPDTRVGKKARLESKQIEAWEYIGVNLKPGANSVSLSLIDPFGNARETRTIELIAPSDLGRIEVDLPAEAPADGRSRIAIKVKLLDNNGVPVTVRTAITLESTRAVWQVRDLDSKEPGVQVFIEGGSAQFTLLAPAQPGEDTVRISSGILKTEKRLRFLPALRPMVAVGVVEGAINLRNLDLRNLAPVRQYDSFEREIRNWSSRSADGKTQAAGRTALYLKGKVKGDYLLTLAYDSDKDLKERLFRDIQPDEFYPVYGDASLRAFDAQSTERLYVRIDKGASFLLYGDYTTQSTSPARQLSQYSRSLTGLQSHYETPRAKIDAFASQSMFRQVVVEFPANGTSGPFQLQATGIINSEKVELLTRDRNQPSMVIKTQPQSRFSDYEIEVFTGRILFKAPIASFDPNLNPNSIRVTYEVEQGGQEYWVGGAEGRYRLNSRTEVGANIVHDSNPLTHYSLGGTNATVKLGAGSTVTVEAARSESDTAQSGNAARVEWRQESERLTARVYAAQASTQFDNPSSSLVKGRTEAGARAAYKLTPRTTVSGEALHSEDTLSGGKRDGALLKAEHTLPSGVRVEGGMRHSVETATPAQSITAGTTPNDLTTLRGRVTAPIPRLPQATTFGEYEQDIHDSAKRLAAVGGEYQIANRGKAYARYEILSSLSSPYALNDAQRRATSIVGIDTEYMRDQHVFSEYRMRDALDERSSEAALGLRGGWMVAPGLRLNASTERVQSLSRSAKNPVDTSSQAYTTGLEYIANPLWKGSSRLEYRTGASSQSWLGTLAAAVKISQDWTGLGRSVYTVTENTGSATGSRNQTRLQVGAAYRDTETNRWDALMRTEYRLERDDTQSAMPIDRVLHIASMHVNYQPAKAWIVSGQYAAKHVDDQSNNIASSSLTHLAAARLMVDVSRRWDIGMQTSTLFSPSSDSRQYGLGAEVGYQVERNVWVSVGYNVFGFRETDLAEAQYLQKGIYVRLRLKFDEKAMPWFETDTARADAADTL